LRANNDADAVLRHGIVMGLVGAGDRAALAATVTDASAAVRLGAVLALRRLRSPDLARFLADADPAIAREAALAINDAPVPEAMEALAAMLTQPTADEPVLFRAINAHFRLGTAANAAAIADFATRADAPPRARAEALAQLAQWPKPLQRDRLVGVYRPTTTPTRDRAVAVAAVERVARPLLAPGTPSVVQSAALEAMQSLAVAGAADALFAMVRDERQAGAARASALAALDAVKDARLKEAVAAAGASADSTLRLAALPIATRLSPEAAAPVLANLVNFGTAAEKKTAFRSLGFSRNAAADQLLADQLRALAAGNIPTEVQLELVSAAGRRQGAEIKTLLAEREAALTAAAAKEPLAPFRIALAGGNAERGRRTFESHPVLACMRCHRAGGDGGEAGPNLAGFGAKHDREYILESIVKPNARIAPGYDTVVVTRKDGSSAAGIVASETDGVVTLRDAENRLVEVRKTDIAKREGAPSGMPEVYATILTKTELRDVVEYVASLTSGEQKSGAPLPRALRGVPTPPKTAE
ncbi:MAG: c-type cytochrome, partial [Opitutaceae bacterium]